MGNFKMNDDYVDVAERIRQFKELYPDGSLQTIEVEWLDGLVIAKAAAYRTPDDERPGIGMASEPVPGKTPYTRDSELMNAETSAWGRAIVAVGIPTKRIASSNEVQNRDADRQQRQTRRDEQAEAAAPAEGNGHITKTQAKRLHEMLYSKGRESSWFLKVLAGKGIGDGEHLTSIPSDQYESLLEIVVGFADPEPVKQPAPDPVDATDFEQPAPAPQEPASEPQADEADEEPPGMDADAYKASRIPADADKPRKKGTVTAAQLTRLGALCADLENLGVGRDEWRLMMFEKESVASRTELTKAAATRMIDYLVRWVADVTTGVEHTAA
jgi:hypothetical protein